MKQTMLIQNKKQLLTAISCAINFCGITEITLQRETGVTTYFFDATNFSYHHMLQFNAGVRRARSRIRKMKAILLKE